MDTNKKAYEVPTMRCDGDVVRQTQVGLVNDIESDATGLFALGSVGFGV